MSTHLIKTGHHCEVLTLPPGAFERNDVSFALTADSLRVRCIAPGLIVPEGIKRSRGQLPGFFHRLLRKTARFFFLDDFHSWAMRAARQYLLQTNTKPDVVISSALPVSCHWAGRRISEAVGACWIAEYRDLWVGNPVQPMTRPTATEKLRRQAELLSRADLVLGISDEMVDELRRQLKPGARLATLMNAFEGRACAAAGPRRLIPRRKMVMTYTGTLYHGHSSFRALFRALNRLKSLFHSPDFPLEIVYAGSDGPLLKREATQYGAAGLVRDVGRVSRATSLALQQDADLLLITSGKGDPAEGMIVTGKVFEYLKAARPILAFGFPSGSLGRVLAGTGAGKIFHPDDEDGILAHLTSLVKEFKTSGTVSYQGDPAAVNKHSWDQRISELLDFIEEIREVPLGLV
jgi:glycosyltransferase involved in cell wall biosynthesis